MSDQKFVLFERFLWLDCLKFLAIIAVAIDHCNQFLYTDPLIALSSWFSVSLFILCSGCGVFFNKNRKKTICIM